MTSPEPTELDLLAREIASQVSQASEPSFVATVDGEVVTWNPAVGTLTGTREVDALGQRCWEVLGAMTADGSSVCSLSCAFLAEARNGRSAGPVDAIVRTEARQARATEPGRLSVVMHHVTLRDVAGTPRVVLHVIEEARGHRQYDRAQGQPTVARGPNPVRPDLGPREHEILQLLAAGLTTRDLAAQLEMRHATARNAVQHLLTKLNAPTRAAAVSKVLTLNIAACRATEQRLAAHSAVTRILAESTTLADAGPRLLAEIGEQLGWELGDVWLVDRETGSLRSAAVWQRAEAETDDFLAVSLRMRFTRGVGLPGQVWASGKPVWIENVLKSTTFVRRRAARAAGIHTACAFPVLRPDGDLIGVFDLLSRAVRPPDPGLMAVFADIGLQIGEFVQREHAETERARMVAAIGQSPDAVLLTDSTGATLYVNPAFERLSGYKSDELLGQNPRLLKSGQQEAGFYDEMWATLSAGRSWSGSFVNRRKDGTLYQTGSVISPVLDAAGMLIGFLQVARDVTRERELEGELARRARERRMIETTLERIDSSSSPEEVAAIACAQVIELPNVDSAFVIALAQDHGQILAVAGRLAAAFHPGRLIPGPRVRYLLERVTSGVWTEEWRTRPEDGMFGEQVAATGLHTVAYAPLRGPLGVIGVVGFGTHDQSPDETGEQLPVLMSIASILGTLLAPGVEARQRDDDERANIQAILDAGVFTPFFQPIVELHTGAVVGYEALSRFADGTRPDLVFAAAARVRLGVELEVATLEAALGAAGVLPPEAYLNLNVSPALILSGRLTPLLATRTRQVTLEITEHVVIEDYAALRDALAALGPRVRVAVDDAGAGYASLRHVLELAPDFVKLDIALIRGIDADPARQALIAGMGYFALKRKLRLVAEGIETPAELRALRALAIGYGQGYLLGRPQDGRGPGPWPTRISLSTNDGGQG